MRTEQEIIADLLAGRLDLADVKIKTRVQIDEIDKSGDTPRLARTRVFVDGQQTDVLYYGKHGGTHAVT